MKYSLHTWVMLKSKLVNLKSMKGSNSCTAYTQMTSRLTQCITNLAAGVCRERITKELNYYCILKDNCFILQSKRKKNEN